MDLLIHLVGLVFLFLLGAFFSASETAIFSLSKIERRRLQQAHPRIGKWVQLHLDHPRQSLVTILIGNLVVHTLAAAIVTLLVLKYLGPDFLGPVLALFTFTLIFFAEIMPKTFAVRKNEKMALIAAAPLHIVSWILFPFRWLVRWITEKIVHFLIPEKKEHTDQISEEELKTLVKIGEEEGVLDRQEHYMIQKLLAFGERTVKDIMTPRTALAALDLDEQREKHLEMIRKYHFSHFPVYQGSLDNLLGVVPVQEYVLDAQTPVNQRLKQPLFVPEFKRIDDLLAEFRAKGQNFAVCVDEYGGTAGIVTLEDIFEEIFGEFYDEYTKPENMIRPVGQQEFIVEAKIPLAEFNEFFSLKLESEEASTLAGFILEKMGEVPEKGKVLELPECQIRIHDVLRQRQICTVIVRPAAKGRKP